MIRSFLIVGILFSAFANAAPPTLKVSPLGKPDAEVKGTLNRNVSAEPETLNPVTATDGYALSDIFPYVLEGLLYRNPDTDKWEPELAESYEVSKDFLTYTFFLRKDAKFSDGTAVTAEDVKFSIEFPKNPAYKAASRAPYYEDVESVEVVNPTTVRVKMKKKYFLNDIVLASEGYTPILPKHIYDNPNKKWNGETPLFGSGPYKVEAYNRGKNLVLVKNKDYWGANLKDNHKGMAKFEHLNFRFVKDENLEIEMVKKGDIDYMQPITADNFVQKATGEPFGTKIEKVKAVNFRPKNWGFVGWNNKNAIFSDRNVRVALSKLLNRKLLIEKFMFGLNVPASSPVYYTSPFKDPSIKPIDFDPSGAKDLLKKAGWEDKEKKGILQKTIDGKPVDFRFSLLLPNRDAEKYFTIYKEDLKKAGIDMEIKLIEWSTFVKVIDEQKFEAVAMSWGGGSPEDDPKQIWHSDSSKMGGSNFISYSNKEVDKLIDQARGEMNAGKRKAIWQKVYKMIADDAPYTFLFNSKFDLYLLNNRIGYDKNTYKNDLSYPFFYTK